MHAVSPLAKRIIMNPPPPRFPAEGWVTASANAVATAASTGKTCRGAVDIGAGDARPAGAGALTPAAAREDGADGDSELSLTPPATAIANRRTTTSTVRARDAIEAGRRFEWIAAGDAIVATYQPYRGSSRNPAPRIDPRRRERWG